MEENHVNDKLHDSEPYHYLATNSSAINQLLFIHDLTITSIDSSPTVDISNQISGKFNNELLAIDAGIMQSSE